MTDLRSISAAAVLRLAVLAALPCVLTGCLLNPAPVQAITYYDLRSADTTAPAAPAAPADGKVLSVESFEAVGPYHRRLVYRQTNQELQFDEYHRWAAEPSDLIAAEVYRHLQADGPFGRVTLHRKLSADYLVYGELDLLESRPGKEAVVGLHMVLEDRNGKALLDSNYEVTQSFDEGSPEAYVAATATALQTLLERATADMRAALQAAQVPETAAAP